MPDKNVIKTKVYGYLYKNICLWFLEQYYEFSGYKNFQFITTKKGQTPFEHHNKIIFQKF